MNRIHNVLAIIVLYKTKVIDSATYRSLKDVAALTAGGLDVLIYDNSPAGSEQPLCPEDDHLRIQYIHDVRNLGLGVAYNKGLELARENRREWLLLLDQDTTLPPGFLGSFENAAMEGEEGEIVCALPKVVSPEGRSISPIRVFSGDIYRSFPDAVPGRLTQKVTGINSGTFLSVDFMTRLGGFDKRFPLDMLDHWYFSEIIRTGKKVWLLDIVIVHQLSIYNLERDVSLERYSKIVQYESLFYRRTLLSYIVFKVRLVKRLFEQIGLRQKGFFFITLRNLVRL